MTVTQPGRAVFPAVERDQASAAFFAAAARGELLVKRCPRGGDVLGPEARTCPSCGSVELTPVIATGRGTLISWAVVHRAPAEALAAAVPYVTAIVELAEGAWLMVRLVGCDATRLRVGLPVAARFVPSGGAVAEAAGEVLVAFAPVPAEGAAEQPGEGPAAPGIDNRLPKALRLTHRRDGSVHDRSPRGHPRANAGRGHVSAGPRVGNALPEKGEKDGPC